MFNLKTLTLMALSTIAVASLSACNSNDKQAASGGTQNTVAAASNVVAVVAPPSPGLPLYNFTVVSESWSLNGAASTSSAPDLSAYTALAADASYIESIDAAIQTQQDNLELYSKGVLIGVISLPASGGAPSFSYSSQVVAADSISYSFTAGANSQTAGTSVLVFNLSECVDQAQGSQTQQGKGGKVQACDTVQVTVNFQEVMPAKK